jgi:hypothetical protein
MDDFDIPIFKQTYDLYKTFYSYRNLIPKQDRYAIYERCEGLILDVLESILTASKLPKGTEKLANLERASIKLNFLRVFIRLMKETRAIDAKKYIAIQAVIDEVGRQIGGWIRSTRQ